MRLQQTPRVPGMTWQRCRPRTPLTPANIVLLWGGKDFLTDLRNDSLTKPIRGRELLSSIRRCLAAQIMSEQKGGSVRAGTRRATSRLFEKLPNSETDRPGIPTARDRNES